MPGTERVRVDGQACQGDRVSKMKSKQIEEVIEKIVGGGVLIVSPPGKETVRRAVSILLRLNKIFT